ncbi:immunoglobulin kappa light chain [Esox lucius]|uniref:immunoglobulin kappa light chain n=1 Tax=Esox lucius TaxID=8010 RepID=UPI0005778EC0|nr:immunoglobulin kappa light chain [Esox lucius]
MGLFWLTFILVVTTEAVNLHQEKLTLTRTVGKSGVIECRATDFSTSNIYWYFQKDGEALTRILFMHKGGGKPTRDPGYDHYQAEKGEGSLYTLTIPSLSKDNAATYYCASFDTHKILQFGSGSKLFISESQVRKPKVTVYPASTPEPNGNTTLLCLARDMFPDLVKISWKMKDENGKKVEIPEREKIELIQTDNKQTTSMIIVDKEKADKYICLVKHEWGDTEVTAKGSNQWREQDVEETMIPQCRPGRNESHDSFQSMFSLNLASLAYTVMIVKSLVYSCGLAVLLQLRNMGSRPSIQRRTLTHHIAF